MMNKHLKTIKECSENLFNKYSNKLRKVLKIDITNKEDVYAHCMAVIHFNICVDYANMVSNTVMDWHECGSKIQEIKYCVRVIILMIRINIHSRKGTRWLKTITQTV